MKTFVILTSAFLCSCSFVPEKNQVAKAPNGKFYVTHDYIQIKNNDLGESVEKICFADKNLSPLILQSFPWAGIYEISPDSKWIFRTQKTGSGDNIGILYHVSENSHVTEVKNFDERAWQASDKISRLKIKNLYHTHIEEISWSKNNSTMECVLVGTNYDMNGDGIKTHLIYDLNTDKFLLEKCF